MDIPKLKAERINDPKARGYAEMNDVEIANDFNIEYVERIKTSMTGSEVLNAVVPSEYNALTADDKKTAWNILHLGNLNPSGVEATMLVSIFGVGSGTVTALKVLRTEKISRATDLGLGFVYPGHIENTRL